MTGDILFLAHRIPFPPDRGDKIRSHHLLKALAQLAPVHVGCFAENAADLAAENDLSAVAATHALVNRNTSLPVAGAKAVLRGLPVSLTAFGDVQIHHWVAQTLAAHPVDTIVVFSGQMGQYVPDDFAGRVIVDLCDVDSAKFEAYAEDGTLPMRWVHQREGRLLKAEEARLADRADATLLVSDAEARLLESRLDDGIHATVLPLRNGIDTAFFDPAKTSRHPVLSAASGPHCVFTGQMDYPPNVAAVERCARAIMPLVRQSHPGAQFHIVGRAPTAGVMALGHLEGVTVWGEVPDVRPFLASADAVVAPLTIARGVQNKVLEAMAMARPVVSSPQAATGIDAAMGTDWAVADTDAELAQHICRIASDPEHASAMGQAARSFVVERQGWAAMLAPLAGLVARAPASKPDESARDAA